MFQEVDHLACGLFAVMHYDVSAFPGCVFRALHDAMLGIHGGVLAETLGSLGPILGLDPTV